MGLQNVVAKRLTARRPEPVEALSGTAPDLAIRLAQSAWLVMTLLLLALVVLSLPPLYALSRTTGANTDYPIFQFSASDAALVQSLGISLDFFAAIRVVDQLLATIGFASISFLMVRRRPNDPIVLLSAFALLALSLGGTTGLVVLTISSPAYAVPVNLVNGATYATWCVYLYVFPDGHWVPRWTRFPVLITGLGASLWVVAGSAAGHGGAARDGTALPLLTLVTGGLLAQIYRYVRVSGRVQQQQAKWAITGFILSMAAFALEPGPGTLLWWMPPAYPILVVPLLIHLQMVPIALGMSAAMLHWRLWSLDRLINRTLVYGSLGLFMAAVYLLFLGGFAAVMSPNGSASALRDVVLAALATGLIALLIGPLRRRIQRAANQLMYGERDEPYAVLSRLGQQLEALVDPGTMLPTIVETVADALKLPYVELALKQGQQLHLAAAYGTRQVSDGNLLAFPLVYLHETVGELRVAPRALGEALTPADRALLTNLARQAGAAAHAVQLIGELELSLQRMVNAREEARRRLGSDLHDGLGHRLAGLLRKAEMASNLLDDKASDPVAARLLLGELQGQARAAIDEVRSLAHTLHPPELELLGLAGALRERARDYQQVAGGGERLQIVVEAPEPLASLPAAVEAAAYYIAQEALTNVARHAHARHCQMRLRLTAPGETNEHDSLDSIGGATDGQSTLELEICDDGRGPGMGRAGQAGLGLTSMRERAAELGGTCAIESLTEGGTRVFARLPYPPE